MTLAEAIKQALEKAQKAGDTVNIDTLVSEAEAAINGIVAEKMEGLNNKNQELLGKLKTNKEIVDSLPEGFSAEKWDGMVKSLEGVDLSKLQTPEQVEAVKKSLAESHQKEQENSTKQIEALRGELQNQLVTNAVSSAISEAHGNTALLLPHIAKQVKMVEEDGKFRAVVVDDNGTERFSMKQAGETMSIPELVSEFKTKETYAPAFSAGNGGGGSGGGSGGGTIKNPFAKGTKDYSLTEQGRLMNSQPEVAKQLQEAAQASAG